MGHAGSIFGKVMLAIGIASVSVAASALGDKATTRNEPTAKERNHAGRSGDLYLLQLWSDDHERFLRQWAEPTPPNLTTTNRIQRNKPIYLFVIFAGCRADARGLCNLVGTIDILDPDGASYDSHANVKIWDNRGTPGPKLLTLSPLSLGVTVEDGEKLGDYRVRLSVTDVNANVTARTEDVITVVEAATE